MAKPKGSPKTGGGSRKGKPNKTTVILKEAILGSFAALGGAEYLVQLGRENMTAYATLLGKVLPLQLSGDADNPVAISVVERVIVDTKAAD